MQALASIANALNQDRLIEWRHNDLFHAHRMSQELFCRPYVDDWCIACAYYALSIEWVESRYCSCSTRLSSLTRAPGEPTEEVITDMHHLILCQSKIRTLLGRLVVGTRKYVTVYNMHMKVEARINLLSEPPYTISLDMFKRDF
jgi:hypothetical protein